MTIDWEQLELPVYEQDRVRGEVWLDWSCGRYAWQFLWCEDRVWAVLDSGLARTARDAYSQLSRCFGEVAG